MSEVNKASIVVDGDVTPLRRKLREAAGELKKVGSEGEAAFARMTGPLAALQRSFVAIGAVLAGGAVFKGAVSETARFAEESINLGRALGVNATVASTYVHALQDIGVPVETFASAAQMLAKRLVENEEEVSAMGLATRDAAGNLRPLNELTTDAIGLLQKYREGADRAQAANVLFGRSFDNNSRLIEIDTQTLAANKAMQEELGTLVGGQNVEAFKAFRSSNDGVTFTMKTLSVTIGNALIPVLTSLNNAFVEAGPSLVRFGRTVMEVFLGIADLFRMVKQAFVSVGSDIGAIAAAFGRALRGDFSGAMEVFRERARDAAKETQRLKDLWYGTGDSFLGKYRSQQTKKLADDPDGGRNFKPPKNKDKTSKESADPSFMSTYEARLAEIKNVYEQENALRQFSKERELAYWRELQQTYALTAKDQLAIAKRTATLELEIRRESTKQQRELEAAGIDSRRAAALAEIEFAEQKATYERENEAITQNELLALQEQFARRRFEIEYQAMLERFELAKLDPNSSPAALLAIKEQMLDIERQYLLRRRELQQAVIVEERATWNSFVGTIGSLWDKGIQAMMNGTLTWRNAWRAILTDMTRWFAVEVVGKQVKDWIVGQAKLLAVKMGFLKAEEVAQQASSTKIGGTKAKEAIEVISANAAEAGSGAAASQASIPIVGPMLALAAMAAVFAAVMALGSRKSAARGYDIPKGLNPLTQLHEEEMVLPQKYANVMRQLAAGGIPSSGEGGDTHHHWTVNAMDARSFKEFLGRNSGALTSALKHIDRNFAYERK